MTLNLEVFKYLIIHCFCTFSEFQIIIWDLQKQSIRMVIPTLGGFVFAVDRSEIQPGLESLCSGASACTL